MVKSIIIHLSEKEHKKLSVIKGRLTWKTILLLIGELDKKELDSLKLKVINKK